MKEMTLEPYAARLDFKMFSAPSSKEWSLMLAEYMETLARHCNETGPCLIGHLKGLALISNHGFLKISLISPDHPAEVEGEIPENTLELSIVLNILVYGHTEKVLERLTRKTLEAMKKAWDGNISMVSIKHNHSRD